MSSPFRTKLALRVMCIYFSVFFSPFCVAEVLGGTLTCVHGDSHLTSAIAHEQAALPIANQLAMNIADIVRIFCWSPSEDFTLEATFTNPIANPVPLPAQATLNISGAFVTGTIGEGHLSTGVPGEPDVDHWYIAWGDKQVITSTLINEQDSQYDNEVGTGELTKAFPLPKLGPDGTPILNPPPGNGGDRPPVAPPKPVKNDLSRYLTPGTMMSPVLATVLASSPFAALAKQLEPHAPNGHLLVSDLPGGQWEPVPGTNGQERGLWVYLQANTGDTIVAYVVEGGGKTWVDSVTTKPQAENP